MKLVNIPANVAKALKLKIEATTNTTIDYRPGEFDVYIDVDRDTPFSSRLSFTLNELKEYSNWWKEVEDEIKMILKQLKGGYKMNVTKLPVFRIKNNKLLLLSDAHITFKDKDDASSAAKLLSKAKFFK